MFLLACCLAATLAADPQPIITAAGAVDRVVEAYGGADLWSEVDTIRQYGRVSPTMRSRGGSLVRELKRPDHLRVSIDYGNYQEEREVQGARGSRDGEPVEGPELQAMILQAARMDIPSILLSHRDGIRDHGLVKRGTLKVRRLELALPGELSLLLDVDPQSWRVLRSAGILRLPNGSPMSFETDYSDFRLVDGRLFAFREVSIAGGTITGETLLDEITVKLRSDEPSTGTARDL
jgi:hypothetical protein